MFKGFVAAHLGCAFLVLGAIQGMACEGLIEAEGDVQDEALHQWLVFGVRAAYAP